MEKHTLKDFIKTYEPDYIQLICGVHLINIDCKTTGSTFIILAFYDKKFYFCKFIKNKKFLILEIK